MNRKHRFLVVLLSSSLCAIAYSSLCAGPIVFEAIDPTATAAGPWPNSHAAAASFDAAAAGLGPVTLINFESAALGTFTSRVIAPGVTATLQGTTTEGGILNINGTTTGFNTTTGGTKRLAVYPTFDVGTATLTFDFAQPIQGFGAYITGLGTANGNLFALFNDGSNRSFPIVGATTGGVKFFGFTDAGAQIVQLALELRNVSGSRDIYSVDDLRLVGVPEPSCAAILFGLIIGIVCGRRGRC